MNPLDDIVDTVHLRCLGLFLCISGCGSSQQALRDAEPFRALEHPGVWMSDGHGYVMAVTADSVRLYHAAGDVCLEHPEGEVSPLDFLDLYRPDEERNVLRVSSVLDPFEYTFRRVRSLPAPCLAPTPSTPISNFSALAAYFGEHYAFFDLYGVSWDERVDHVGKSITNEMDDRALFEAMSTLLRPLKDSHIQIDAEIDGDEAVYDGNPGKTDVAVAEWGDRTGVSADEATNLFRRGYWIADVRDTLLLGKGVMTGNARIQYGVLPEAVGYIAFVSMGGFVDGEFDTVDEERPTLDAIMDDALALFSERSVEAVVIDLSLNIGGYDFIGLDVAGRFAAERTLAFTRRAGDDPNGEDFALYVEPSRGRRFTGRVYVLTSDLTVSAGEILTLSLRALDNVTHVGEKTRGALSTVLTKYLPNGWEVSLSNEVYTDPQGIVWEGRGIEPEMRVSVFNGENPTQGHVEAVRAIAHRTVGLK
jgi:carboxyl-terminal processing protease